MTTDLEALDAWLGSINVGERFRARFTFSDSSQGLSLITGPALSIVVFEESDQWFLQWWGRLVDDDEQGSVSRIQGSKQVASADMPEFAIADMVLDALTELGTDFLAKSYLHAKLIGLAIVGWGLPRRDFRRVGVAAALTSPYEVSVGEPLEEQLEKLNKYQGLTSDPTASALLRDITKLLPQVKRSMRIPARDTDGNPTPSYVLAALKMESSIKEIPGITVSRRDLPDRVVLSLVLHDVDEMPLDLVASPDAWTLTDPTIGDGQGTATLARSANLTISQLKDALMIESNWSNHRQEFVAGMLGYSLNTKSKHATGMLRSLELAAPWMILQGMGHTLRELANGVLAVTKGPQPTRLRRLTRLATGGFSPHEDPFEYLGEYIDAWIHEKDEAARVGKLMQTHPAEYAFHVTVGIVQRLEAMNVWSSFDDDSDNDPNIDWANTYLSAVKSLVDALITGRLLRESSFDNIPASAIQPDPGPSFSPRRLLRESVLEPLFYRHAQHLATSLRAEAFRLSEARLESDFLPDSYEDRESLLVIRHFERVAAELERGELVLNPYYPDEIEINAVPLLSHSPNNFFLSESDHEAN